MNRRRGLVALLLIVLGVGALFLHLDGSTSDDSSPDGAAGRRDLSSTPMDPPGARPGLVSSGSPHAGGPLPGLEIDEVVDATLRVALDGVVVEGGSDKPVVGARVRLVDGSEPDTTVYDAAPTDAHGRFHVRGVHRWGTVLEVSAPPFATERKQMLFPGGTVPSEPVQIRLWPGGRISGTVRDPKGAPLAGALLLVGSGVPTRGEPWVHRSRSAADGSYAVEGLPLGDEYIAWADDAAGFARSLKAKEIRLDRAHREARVDFAMQEPAMVVVRLVDLDGRPVTDAVKATITYPDGERRESGPALGNSLRFDGLGAGEHAILVESPSFRSAELKVRVVEGGTVGVEVRLDPGASLEGTVVDENGRSVASAIVHVVTEGRLDPERGGWVGPEGRQVDADAEGRFLARGLRPAVFEVYADAIDRIESLTLSTAEVQRVRAPAGGVALVVWRPATATLRVRTPSGDPFRGVARLWQGRPGSLRLMTAPTTSDGRFRWSRLESGECEVKVDANGYLPVVRRFTSIAHRNVDLGDAEITPVPR